MRGLTATERAELIDTMRSRGDGTTPLAFRREVDEASEEVTNRLIEQRRVVRTNTGVEVDENGEEWDVFSTNITELGKLALRVCP